LTRLLPYCGASLIGPTTGMPLAGRRGRGNVGLLRAGVVRLAGLIELWKRVNMTTTSNPYRGFRYPAAVIQQAVWLHHCFSLSLRDVELILAARASWSAMRLSARGAYASAGCLPTR
jgi:hypothetical protein